MISRIFLLCSIILLVFEQGKTQDFELLKDIPVFRNGIRIQNPFAGGLKAGQFSTIDLNLDGKEDLVVYDRNSSYITTYINEGAPGDIKFI